MGCHHGLCGHGTGQHEAGGPCLVDGCPCDGFVATAAPRQVGAAITRCSQCNRRPAWKRGSRTWGNHGTGCARAGLRPDRREDGQWR